MGFDRARGNKTINKTNDWWRFAKSGWSTGRMYMFLAMLFLSWGWLRVYVNTGSPCPWNEVASSAEPLRGFESLPKTSSFSFKRKKTCQFLYPTPSSPLPLAYRASRGGPYFCKLHILRSPWSIHFSPSSNLILGCSNLPVVNKQRTACWKTELSQ